MTPMTPLDRLLDDLDADRVSSVELVESALDAADDMDGEGERVFIDRDPEGALDAAEAADALREAGVYLPLLGLPVSVKDLFDVFDETTSAGSEVLADEPTADEDCIVVQRLRAAGAVIVGRTNMTEFAFSGVGLNPHYGTPRNPWDRETGRIPGGSSSGAAVSVTDGMAAAALGTDTGGSIRIPAALCGLAGFKPTQARVPRDGVFPLSFAMDSIGPLAPTIRCCALMDAVLAGETPREVDAFPLAGLRLAVPQGLPLDDMDETVSLRFEAALRHLSEKGAHISGVDVSDVLDGHYVANQARQVTAEAWAIHRRMAEAEGLRYDQRVLARMRAADSMSAADLVDMILWRQAVQEQWASLMQPCDAMIWPTVPTVAPTLAEVDGSEEGYTRWNGLMLRNTRIVNVMDGCAATLPIHVPGEAPVGLQVVGAAGADARILSIAAGLEDALAGMRHVS